MMDWGGGGLAYIAVTSTPLPLGQNCFRYLDKGLLEKQNM